MARYNIRERHRVCSSPPEGQRQSWVEWQVVTGRTVMSRHGTESEAEATRVRLEALGAK